MSDLASTKSVPTTGTRMRLALSFLGLFGLAAWQEVAREARELRLVYLANEGFLLRSGPASVLIDAFVTEPYGSYAAVPRELFEDVLAARPPFDDVDLALTSHAHRDHFQPEPALEFLAARKEVAFLSSRQVVEALQDELGDERRLEAFLPEARTIVETRSGPIRVELLRLPHTGGERTASVQNLGHLLELEGIRVLHVGDADIQAEDLAAYALAGRSIDVALVPYWWFGDARSVARAKELIGARYLVAIHVPPREVAQVGAQLAALDPALILFEDPGEERKLRIDPR